MLNLSNDWNELLKEEFEKNYFKELMSFLEVEYSEKEIFPEKQKIFNSLNLTSFSNVKVLICGQDPYPTPGHANGLAFSVNKGVKIPKSLQNIFKELEDDLGCNIPKDGDLEDWSKQGVLLLNAVLTVRKGEPNSHKGKGWETFVTEVIKLLNKKDNIVSILWGNDAQKKKKLLTNPSHFIIESAHPSPLSMKKFFGSKPFSKANDFLESKNISKINWQL